MYVKLISKPNEWYDEGTEVFDDTISDWARAHKRMTVDQFEIWKKAGHILALGIRNGFWDVELCPLEEFYVHYVDKQIC